MGDSNCWDSVEVWVGYYCLFFFYQLSRIVICAKVLTIAVKIYKNHVKTTYYKVSEGFRKKKILKISEKCFLHKPIALLFENEKKISEKCFFSKPIALLFENEKKRSQESVFSRKPIALLFENGKKKEI